jgi:hypothetical protein
MTEPTDVLPHAKPASGKAALDRLAEWTKYVSLVSGFVRRDGIARRLGRR